MRVLVSGATGFVGRHLVRRLVQRGDEVHLLLRPRSDLSGIGAAVERCGIYRFEGETEALCAHMQALMPDAVVHLASLFLAQHAPRDVRSLVEANVLLGTQMVEAMSQAGVRRFVNTGTSWQHFGSAAYRPMNLYAATKQAFEAVLDYYVEAGQLQVVDLKLFDTFGPEDPRRKLIPVLVEHARTGAALLMSPGEQLIDIVYIDDVVDAYLRTLDLLKDDDEIRMETYAVSSARPIRLRDLVAEFETAAQVKLDVRWGERAYRPREVMVPWTSGRPVPGWTPKVSFAEGVRRVLASHDRRA